MNHLAYLNLKTTFEIIQQLKIHNIFKKNADNFEKKRAQNMVTILTRGAVPP